LDDYPSENPIADMLITVGKYGWQQRG